MLEIDKAGADMLVQAFSRSERKVYSNIVVPQTKERKHGLITDRM